MIMITIIRVSGIKAHDQIDQTWESYWLILSAEIGIILTSITAFRAFFVSRNRDRAIQSPGKRMQWYYENKLFLKRTFNPSLWRSKSRHQSSSEGYEAFDDGNVALKNLQEIPRAHMTGVQTFIDKQGKTMNNSTIMQSQAIQEHDDTWPLSKREPESEIQV